MDHPDYVVIRPALNLPEGFLSKYWDGRWLDRSDVPDAAERERIRRSLGVDVEPGKSAPPTVDVVAVPTGRIEMREDGAVAEVWEVRP